jgi:protein-S-isoprenylcysteine O-methyltransferase Ste14
MLKTFGMFLIGPGLFLVYFPYRIIMKAGKELGPHNALSYPAIFFWLSGAYLIFGSIRSFIFEGKGTPAPWDAPKELVKHRVYKMNRNPMYTGVLMFMLGTYVWSQVFSLLLYLLAFWLLFHLGVLLYEEPTLKKKFGQPYLYYLKSTNRWLPKLK